jgi:glutaredoxin-like protein NrdH
MTPEPNPQYRDVVVRTIHLSAVYRALDSRGIEYEIHDLSEDPGALEQLKALGYLQAPVVITEQPENESKAFRRDLDRVLERALSHWHAPVVTVWLDSGNAFLGGARPLDVIHTAGSAPVLDALEQEISGTYA